MIQGNVCPAGENFSMCNKHLKLCDDKFLVEFNLKKGQNKLSLVFLNGLVENPRHVGSRCTVLLWFI